MWTYIATLSIVTVPLIAGMIGAAYIYLQSINQKNKSDNKKDKIENSINEWNVRTRTTDSQSNERHVTIDQSEMPDKKRNQLNDDEEHRFSLECADMFYELHDRVNILQHKLYHASMVQIALTTTILAFLGCIVLNY